jgi:hypothetical protein
MVHRSYTVDGLIDYLESDAFRELEIGLKNILGYRLLSSKIYISNSWWKRLLYRGDLKRIEVAIKIINDSIVCDEMKNKRDSNGY